MTVNRNPLAPCDMLEWDSDFFHCRIARVRGDCLDDEKALRIDDWSRANRIQGLYFLARSDDPATRRSAEQHGFALTDIRLTLERGGKGRAESVTPEVLPLVTIRPFQFEDLPGLQALARTGHVDGRFFSDEHFTRDQAESFYSTWITQECRGRAQMVLVAFSTSDQPLGYISCHLDECRSTGQIGLLAVCHQARNQGLGKNLVEHALSWLESHDVRVISVVTQGSNKPAQRLYQRCGFLTRELQLWYHKWYSPPFTPDRLDLKASAPCGGQVRGGQAALCREAPRGKSH